MKFKIFLIAFILSLPFWWGVNLLEAELKDFFFWYSISQNPQIFTAQTSHLILEKKLQELKPIRKRRVENLRLPEVKAAISVLIRPGQAPRILFEKKTDKELPIASLVKLMTAYIVLEYYDLSQEIKISREAVLQKEEFGGLKVGQRLSVKYLLYPLLIESSNDAAFALANDYDGMTEKKFVQLMNSEAQRMNMNNTFFVNSTGLDPEDLEDEVSYSTVADLTKIAKELLIPKKPFAETKNEDNEIKKSLIWEILSTPKYDLYGHELINTNKFLWDESIGWQDRIVGGKTGYTERAGDCMFLVISAPKNQGFLVNIILRTNDRFAEMKKMLDWLDLAYKW